MQVRKNNQIAPDGVPITIPWLEVHESVFIPCLTLDTYYLTNYLPRLVQKMGMEKVVIREAVHNDLHGFRLWRTR